MKGTVVGTWINTSQKIWGKDLTAKAMEHVGWSSDKIFSPTEDIEDVKSKSFVAFLGKEIVKSEDEVWLAIGKDNVNTFFMTF